MICPECSSNNIQMLLELIISAPFEYYGNITKGNLRKKDIEILGANWADITLICKDCGWARYKKIPCGHSYIYLVQDKEGTAYCSECEKEANES